MPFTDVTPVATSTSSSSSSSFPSPQDLPLSITMVAVGLLMIAAITWLAFRLRRTKPTSEEESCLPKSQLSVSHPPEHPPAPKGFSISRQTRRSIRPDRQDGTRKSFCSRQPVARSMVSEVDLRTASDRTSTTPRSRRTSILPNVGLELGPLDGALPDAASSNISLEVPPPAYCRERMLAASASDWSMDR